MKIKFGLIILILINLSFARELKESSLFADHKAKDLGDILTVYIMETASASNEAITSTSNSNKLSLSAQGSGSLDFIPEMGMSGGNSNSYAGSGKTARKGTLKATLQVYVKEVLPNGNLLIEGDKVVEVNDEKQITSLSGIVREEDIRANNTIYSNLIANLQITYSGKGVVKEAEEPGIFTRFFNWLF